MNIEELENALVEKNNNTSLNPCAEIPFTSRRSQGLPLGERTYISGGNERRSGRTNRMISGALFELSEGKSIIIVAPNRTILRHIKEKVELVSGELGMLELARSISYLSQDSGIPRGFDPIMSRVYYDHTCDDFNFRNT